LGTGLTNAAGAAASNHPVYAIAVIGGELYVGGNFTSAGGVNATNIAKWDGNSWSPLSTGVTRSDGTSADVFALAVSGSDLYAGGRFTMAGGLDATNIAKWDGHAWSALGPGVGVAAFDRVSALAVSGSDVYAGGDFSTVGGYGQD